MDLKLDQLWIGDFVHSRSLNKTGRFEGEVTPGVARVRFGDQEKLLPADDLEQADDPQVTAQMEVGDPEEESIDVIDTVQFDRTIDLHIEVLNPAITEETPANILRYQLSRCRDFLEQAVRHRADQVKIIHGRGEGVLRREIEILLDDHPVVNHYHEDSRGGAQDVWLDISTPRQVLP
jgi:hypothetical protein